ncbi:MAG TPA: glycoside hydrolase [Candidatus Kryptonia bacterium]
MTGVDKLKVIFIWHHHQPYYKTDGTYLMPWVRMHGIKDYWDMVRILDDYPTIRQTFNFAPSLLEQIEDYLTTGAKDLALLLSQKDPESFTDEDRIEALKTFFFANESRMVRRYQRYEELLEKRGPVKNERDLYSSAKRFTSQDFRDLQVWWNLAWVGEYSRFDPPFKQYLDKGRNFSESEKKDLLDAQMTILRRIVSHHRKAARDGQIEIAISPFYHPILPLLCDTEIAKRADPGINLPITHYRHPEDAKYQIESALRYAKKVFGKNPAGMWPSEGSVSDDALALFAKSGVGWVATDEGILRKTLANQGRASAGEFAEKYFAYRYQSGKSATNIFFRDHTLSDLIGFAYSRWSPDDAARDFISRLLKIREMILNKGGPALLKYASANIVLDGENAWEFYQSDGKDFLRTLYHLFEHEDRLETALPSKMKVKPGNVLKHIEPGSWINGNFNIWIGHPEDNKAWDLLHDARESFSKAGKRISKKKRELAYKEIMIAEGSDWCWWYGDEHKSVESVKFDELFRYHLKRMYLLIGEEPPKVLNDPIKRKLPGLVQTEPSGIITPDINRPDRLQDWKQAGSIGHEDDSGSMQRSGLTIRRLMFGNDQQSIYLRIEPSRELASEKIIVDFYSPWRLKFEVGRDPVFRCEAYEPGKRITLSCNMNKNIAIALNCGEMSSAEASFSLVVLEGKDQIDSLPQQGVAKFKLFQ